MSERWPRFLARPISDKLASSRRIADARGFVERYHGVMP